MLTQEEGKEAEEEGEDDDKPERRDEGANLTQVLEKLKSAFLYIQERERERERE